MQIVNSLLLWILINDLKYRNEVRKLFTLALNRVSAYKMLGAYKLFQTVRKKLEDINSSFMPFFFELQNLKK